MIPAGTAPRVRTAECAVEGCFEDGTRRQFDHYYLTLCHLHYVIAAEAHAKAGQP